MSDEEKKPLEGDEESGAEKPPATGDIVPSGMFAPINTDTLYPKWLIDDFKRRHGDKPGTFNATYIIQSNISWEKSEEYRAALEAKRSFQTSKIANPDNIPGAEPDPKIIKLMRDEMTQALNAAIDAAINPGWPMPSVVNFEDTASLMPAMDLKPVSVDAIDVLMTQYKSLMEKAEAKGIKKGWVFCVPPEFIPALQAELKPFANESASMPIGGLSQLAGIPIYAVHTESGQMEYMPYEVALAKYGSQILPRDNSSEGENSED